MQTTPNHTQDEHGQWWYRPSYGRRHRAYPRSCDHCGKTFLYSGTNKTQRFCSRECADAGRASFPIASVTAERWNPRKNYYRGDDGQWWYNASGQRSRCRGKTCEFCGGEYPIYSGHYKKSRFCSHSCATRSRGWHPTPKIGRSGIRGRRKNPSGYVMIWNPTHPSLVGTQRKYVAEHRLVMEEHLGRQLDRAERVHHKNGVRDDNRLENLELWGIGHPAGQRADDVTWTPLSGASATIYLLLPDGTVAKQDGNRFVTDQGDVYTMVEE